MYYYYYHYHYHYYYLYLSRQRGAQAVARIGVEGFKQLLVLTGDTYYTIL